ncbi:kinesin-like protein KIN-14C [Gastrolobium bilobum]|uniref:kinesin-like protein KIN-14C n=1 Tax=Gastrolobium bilobum TaxID=150636 RepID=UPI002AB10BAA|nr:kinesin-like protein KIN-14C [Gastrolobium bilobum]
MASRNQNRPPRSPSNKKGGGEEVPSDKRRRIGAEKMERQGRARAPFATLNNKTDANDVGGAEVPECGTIDFTKEEVEALLNEKMKKGNPFDTKKKMEQMTVLIKRFKDCVRSFQRKEEGYIQEKEKLQTDLESAERIQASLSTELEKVRIEKSDAERKVMLCYDLDNLHTWLNFEVHDQAISSQEYIERLLQYNENLRSDLNSTNEARKRLETEKPTILENLSNVRAHNKALQEKLASLKASQDEAIQQKEILANDIKCLRNELKQIRDDRDCQLGRVQALTAEVARYEEYTGESCAKLDTLMIKTNALEETCCSQRKQLNMLQQQLIAEKEKLKVADLSASETRTMFEDQNRTIHELQERLAEKEFQVIEGEKLRKKLHNTILELKGNIRVFCRVRPLLPDDGPGADMVVSYPTSTEALGRGIELAQSGQKYPFTFDKVFNHEASQQDVFIEISQLVQSALDGYKVCIFAYGQTGSGKTYTMMGRPDAPELKGLIPRSLELIFQISQSLKDQGWKYKMQASILEIYNETIRDLLSSNRSSGIDLTRTENGVPGKQYAIKHDVNGNTYVSDLTIVDVCSVNEISSLLQQAAQSRSVGKTHMNEQSSRSHFVFTLRICGINENTEQQVQGVLNLIDLAGSERLSRSGATGDRLKETQAINKSLSSLSDVIFALAKKEEHVPFRNSKLTYLLQPCLGGDSKTLMFVNISPDPVSTGESLCSLRFAARVNACEIGIPRRQTSTRSFDSRLSCG